MAMEVLQSQDDLGRVKLGGVLVKRSHLPDVVQQLSSLCITQPKIFTKQQQSGKLRAKKSTGHSKPTCGLVNIWTCVHTAPAIPHRSSKILYLGKISYIHMRVYIQKMYFLLRYHVLLICLKS